MKRFTVAVVFAVVIFLFTAVEAGREYERRACYQWMMKQSEGK